MFEILQTQIMKQRVASRAFKHKSSSDKLMLDEDLKITGNLIKFQNGLQKVAKSVLEGLTVPDHIVKKAH